MTAARDAVLSACLAYLRGRSDLGAFATPFQGAKQSDIQPAKIEPQVVPYQNALSEMLDHTDETSRSLVQAIINASGDMRWNRTYSEAEVGADFLRRYGWFDVIAPEGPFRFECGRRLMIGCWGQGLDYQAHWHDPAEVYIPIAGSATFWAEGSGFRQAGVGDAVFHAPNQKHATNFDQSPFMALIIWQADDLGAKLSIQDRETGQVVRPDEIK